MKSGCCGALKPDRLGLICKDNKCSHVGTGDLGVLPAQEKLPMNTITLDAKWSTELMMPVQPAPDECRHKYKYV